MKIGIPRETKERETRVALTPDVVKSLVAKGYQITVESGAGTGSSFSDEDYRLAGAEISSNPGAIYTGSECVLKVNPPSSNEISSMAKGSKLISFMWAATNRDLVQ